MKLLLALAITFFSVTSHAKPAPETEHFAPLLGSWLVSGR